MPLLKIEFPAYSLLALLSLLVLYGVGITLGAGVMSDHVYIPWESLLAAVVMPFTVGPMSNSVCYFPPAKSHTSERHFIGDRWTH